MIRHKLIAIEGGDGSGKATQTKLLSEHLRVMGYDVLSQDFPRYGEFSALYIERYLNGHYGAANDVPADLAGLAYALDRAVAAPQIKSYLEKENSIVVLDRSTASNMAHQGTKFKTKTERHKYYEEAIRLEYELLNVPRPDLCIVLLVPPKISQTNIDKKSTRGYTDKKRDAHEADVDHLDAAKRNYQELCELHPNYFISIDCMETDGVTQRAVEDIQQEIRHIIST